MSDLEKKVDVNSVVGNKICTALAEEIRKLELGEAITGPNWSEARFSLIRDPALGEESLEARWVNQRGAKLGSATIHADGSFFAEYDIIRPHPAKTNWFIEAVSAWGKDNTLKSEARLLPVPE